MLRVILWLSTLGVMIYALIDCWRSTEKEVRGLSRQAWLLVILLIPAAGAVAFLVSGRVKDTATVPRYRTVAPDDDPDFLRALQQRARRDAEETRRRNRKDRKDRSEGRAAEPESGDDGDEHPGRQKPL